MFDWLKKNPIRDENADAAEYHAVNQAITAYLAATKKTLTQFDELKQSFNVPEIAPHVERLVQLCKPGDQETLNYAIGIVAQCLKSPDLFQAGRAALLIGVLVERGGSPTLALPDVLSRVPEILTRARALFDIMQAENAGLEKLDVENFPLLARYFDTMPDAVKAVCSLPLLLRPAITMLCRDVPARIAARQNGDLVRAVAAMDEIQSEATCLHQVLQLIDDAPFLILHTGQKKGFQVRVTGVRNNFHLFTLLQGALIGPGKLTGTPPNWDIVAAARGDAPINREMTDSAAFGYYSYLRLRQDRTWDTSLGGTSWLWGEMSPDTTPLWKGQHVILLDKLPLSSRGWNYGFFASLHDAMRSFVAVKRTLPPHEVDNIMADLTKAAQQAANAGD